MLYRSLYFLFHDARTVRTVIEDLEKNLGLDDYQLHAIVNEGHTLMELPGATVRKKSAAGLQAEKLLWYLTVGVFAVSLIALVLTLLASSWFLAALFALLVVAAQASGYLFGNRIPNAQLDRFRTGLEQGDIVLQVDVPQKDVAAVKAYISGLYPQAKTNISNWHVGMMGL